MGDRGPLSSHWSGLDSETPLGLNPARSSWGPGGNTRQSSQTNARKGENLETQVNLAWRAPSWLPSCSRFRPRSQTTPRVTAPLAAPVAAGSATGGSGSRYRLLVAIRHRQHFGLAPLVALRRLAAPVRRWVPRRLPAHRRSTTTRRTTSQRPSRRRSTRSGRPARPARPERFRHFRRRGLDRRRRDWRRGGWDTAAVVDDSSNAVERLGGRLHKGGAAPVPRRTAAARRPARPPTPLRRVATARPAALAARRAHDRRRGRTR